MRVTVRIAGTYCQTHKDAVDQPAIIKGCISAGILSHSGFTDCVPSCCKRGWNGIDIGITIESTQDVFEGKARIAIFFYDVGCERLIDKTSGIIAHAFDQSPWACSSGLVRTVTG